MREGRPFPPRISKMPVSSIYLLGLRPAPGGTQMKLRRSRLLLSLSVLVLLPLFGPAATMQQAPKRAIEVEDVIAWKSIGATVLSSDGQWFGYRLAPQEGDAEIVLKRAGADKEWRFPAGEQPQAGGGAVGGGRG